MELLMGKVYLHYFISLIEVGFEAEFTKGASIKDVRPTPRGKVCKNWTNSDVGGRGGYRYLDVRK